MRIPTLRVTMKLVAAGLLLVGVLLVLLGMVGVDSTVLVVLGVGAVLLATLAVVFVDLRHTHRDLVRLSGGLRQQLLEVQARNLQFTAWADKQRVELHAVGSLVRANGEAAASSGVATQGTMRTLADASRADLYVAYNQLAALLDLHELVPLRAPLPPTRSWAASPDVLTRLIAEVEDRRPSLVVECGSGVSSIVLGYAVQKLGAGRVVALEHDPDFAEETRANLRAHGLGDVVEVRDAPLRPWPSAEADEQFQWYDPAALEGLGDIGLVFVDGPPGRLGPHARYPAVPALLPISADDVLFVLDDTIRADEQEVSALWSEQFPELTVVSRPAEKGMHLLSRSGSRRPA